MQFIQDDATSEKKTAARIGQNYYEGKHDILNKKRTAIGDDGKLVVIENLPNSKIVDNQYRKMVNQKSNYLVGQPFVLQCDNQTYVDALKKEGIVRLHDASLCFELVTNGKNKKW